MNPSFFLYFKITLNCYLFFVCLFVFQTSVSGGGLPRAEVMADTAVALASANVKLVSAKVIERLCNVRTFINS